MTEEELKAEIAKLVRHYFFRGNKDIAKSEETAAQIFDLMEKWYNEPRK